MRMDAIMFIPLALPASSHILLRRRIQSLATKWFFFFSSSSSSSIGGAGRNPAYRTSAFEAVYTFNPVF
jgi:hypothetical protein